MNDREQPRDGVKSLTKALNLLKLFTASKGEWSYKELAEALGYHKSSVQRIVSTLEAHGFIGKTYPLRGQFRLGPIILMLGNVASQSTDLRTVARPFLQQLADQTGETSHLCVVDQSQCYYLDKIDSQQAIRISTYVGQRLPLHCSAVGKALMSGMTVEEVDRIIEERGLTRFTANTITDRERLLEELARIRKEGIAFDNEEYDMGLRCLASPVMDSQGRVVAAISLSGPVQRLNMEVLEKHAGHVKKAAREVSVKLGHSFGLRKG